MWAACGSVWKLLITCDTLIQTHSFLEHMQMYPECKRYSTEQSHNFITIMVFFSYDFHDSLLCSTFQQCLAQISG